MCRLSKMMESSTMPLIAQYATADHRVRTKPPEEIFPGYGESSFQRLISKINFAGASKYPAVRSGQARL